MISCMYTLNWIFLRLIWFCVNFMVSPVIRTLEGLGGGCSFPLASTVSEGPYWQGLHQVRARAGLGEKDMSRSLCLCGWVNRRQNYINLWLFKISGFWSSRPAFLHFNFRHWTETRWGVARGRERDCRGGCREPGCPRGAVLSLFPAQWPGHLFSWPLVAPAALSLSPLLCPPGPGHASPLPCNFSSFSSPWWFLLLLNCSSPLSCVLLGAV